ncbi:MAG: hypothetical protein H7123_00540, partial [Thermoleophilia bacterium]|nr:hypothetical protein [Thermoleophilia bacterium]
MTQSVKSPHTPGAVLKPAFLHTYEQTKAELYELQRQFPDLVHVEDIGDSYEKTIGTADRDILSVRLTSHQSTPDLAASSATSGATMATAPAKPRALWIAGVHPIETANPELMVRFIRELAQGYGHNAEATALLDSRELDIVPMANPDGHAIVEHGYDTHDVHQMQRRKNTGEPFGTDLNRNYDFHWGLGKGSGSDPHSNKFRGSAAFSEPETRAIADFAKRLHPGEFIDWHPPGQDVLFPWGDTKQPPPDAAAFTVLAAHMANLAGYTSEQASKYSTSQGTSDDYMYGALGIPAFTVESGTTSRQHDAEFAHDWRVLKPAMMWAAKVSDDAFARGGGPDVIKVNVTPVRQLLSAVVSDAHAGGEGIVGAEAFTDWAATPGSGVPMRAFDGTFDSPSERVRVPTTALGLNPASRHAAAGP